MSPRPPGALRLASAGIAIVGVCFGMARYGYGLLLPDVRRDYGLGPAMLGALATGSYVAYLAAAALTGVFTARAGERRTVVAAGLLAAGGMTIAGLSRSATVFAAGILVAGASAGLAFAPFADAVRAVAPAGRGRVLAAISSGTGYGVALAAPIAILAGASWRSAWLAFAAAALAATWWAARVLPRRAESSREADRRGAVWRSVLCRRALPLLAGGVLVGVGSSAYWTFAVEYLAGAGALSPTAGRVFLGVVGVASVLATMSAELVRRLGSAPAYVLTASSEAAAIVLLALAPTSLGAAIVSAILFGAAYSAVIAIQAIWSTKLFASRPSLGVSAVMASNGAGFVVGPLGAGLLAGALGLGVALLAGAAVVMSICLLAPRQFACGEDVRSPSAGRAASPRRRPART